MNLYDLNILPGLFLHTIIILCDTRFHIFKAKYQNVYSCSRIPAFAAVRSYENTSKLFSFRKLNEIEERRRAPYYIQNMSFCNHHEKPLRASHNLKDVEISNFWYFDGQVLLNIIFENIIARIFTFVYAIE